MEVEEPWLDPCLPSFPLFENQGFLGSGSEDELGGIPLQSQRMVVKQVHLGE